MFLMEEIVGAGNVGSCVQLVDQWRFEREDKAFGRLPLFSRRSVKSSEK